jgi:hypothetical protein
MKQRTKETKRTGREDRVHEFEREMVTEKEPRRSGRGGKVGGVGEGDPTGKEGANGARTSGERGMR